MSAIIASVDFSDSTSSVIKTAVSLAKMSGLPLVLCHVAEPTPQFVGGDATFEAVQIPMPQDLTPSQHQLEQIERETRQEYPNTSSTLLSGLAVEEILELVRASSADYLVLGSHGRGALYHLFAGSVVTGVLKKAARPVVVVPAPKNQAKG